MSRDSDNYPKIVDELLELERKNLREDLQAEERSRWVKLTKIVFGTSDELAEKRKHFRLQTTQRAEILSPGHLGPARVRSIGGGGLFLETQQLPEVGSQIEMLIDVPNKKQLQQRFRGKVRWISRGELAVTGLAPGVGIQFEELDESQQEAILDVLRDYFDRNLSVLLEKYRFFFHHSPDITLLLDSLGCICEFNEQARAVLREGCAQNRPIEELVDPASAEQLRAAIARAHSSGQAVRCEVAVPQPADGGPLPLDVLLVSVCAEELDLGVLFVGRDLSERVLIEEQRRQMERRLYQGDKLASLGRIAAGIAHDINNPLAWLLSNVTMLKEELPQIRGAIRRQLELELPGDFCFDREVLGELNRDLEDIVQETLVGAYRIRDIIQDLKIFSRVDVYQEEEFDVNDALETSLRIVRNQIQQRATLICDYGPPLITCLNSGKVSQVFLNLITNALMSFTADDVQQNCLTVKTWAEDGWIKVSVADNGCGISPEAQQKIFDPFFSTNNERGGTGLGLAIVQDALNALDGTIAVQSEVGGGSCFTVSLPVRALPDRAEELPRGATNVQDVKPRLLVVDDEEVLLRVLKRGLKRRWEISTAKSSSQALALLDQEQPFDLILCDVMIPGQSGVSLYRTISSRYPGLENRIVFMTGGAFAEQEKRFLVDLPNVVVEKPFKLDEIEQLLLDIFGRLGTFRDQPATAV